MKLIWTSKAQSDLDRLYQFLKPVNPRAAAKTVKALIQAPERLLTMPRFGETLEEFQPDEVRRLLIADYEMRYEIYENNIYILRIFHMREYR